MVDGRHLSSVQFHTITESVRVFVEQLIPLLLSSKVLSVHYKETSPYYY